MLKSSVEISKHVESLDNSLWATNMLGQFGG